MEFSSKVVPVSAIWGKPGKSAGERICIFIFKVLKDLSEFSNFMFIGSRSQKLEHLWISCIYPDFSGICLIYSVFPEMAIPGIFFYEKKQRRIRIFSFRQYIALVLILQMRQILPVVLSEQMMELNQGNCICVIVKKFFVWGCCK